MLEKKLLYKKKFGNINFFLFRQMDPSAYIIVGRIASLRGKESEEIFHPGFLPGAIEFARYARGVSSINRTFQELSRDRCWHCRSPVLFSLSLIPSRSSSVPAASRRRRRVDIYVEGGGGEGCMVSIYFPFNVKLTQTSYSVFKS